MFEDPDLDEDDAREELNFDAVTNALRNPEPRPRAFPNITDREREVAFKLCDALTNQEIADELGLSIKTVDSHRSRLIKKLGVKNNVALARLAMRQGWIDP